MGFKRPQVQLLSLGPEKVLVSYEISTFSFVFGQKSYVFFCSKNFVWNMCGTRVEYDAIPHFIFVPFIQEAEENRDFRGESRQLIAFHGAYVV